MGKQKYVRPPREVIQKQYIEENKSRSELALLHGTTIKTIKKWLAEYNIKKQLYLIPSRDKLFEEYIQNHKTQDEIALSHGVSRNTVKRWLDKYNIPRRKGVHNKKRPKKEELTILYLEEKKGLNEIADTYGVKKRTILSWTGKYYSKEEKDVRRGFIASGYAWIYKPEHPRCDKKGYILEHQYVMELIIGRYLERQECIHHLDLNKINNDINNLVLFANRKDHQKFHRYIELIGLYLLKLRNDMPEPIIFEKPVFYKRKWITEINLSKENSHATR